MYVIFCLFLFYKLFSKCWGTCWSSIIIGFVPNLNERTCNWGASVVTCHTVQLHLKTCEFLAEHLIHWECANIFFFIQYFSLCCFIVFNRLFPIQSTASLNDISFITITAILMQSRYNNWGQSLGVSTYLTVMLFCFFFWYGLLWCILWDSLC